MRARTARRCSRSIVAAIAVWLVLGSPPARPARASAPSLFGAGTRSAALARADIADGDPTDAPAGNAASAAEPGFRLRLGYGYGAMGLAFNGEPAGVRDASGVEIAAQIGASLSRSFAAGFALGVRIPDTSIASIAFRPATEPQFPLYEAVLRRTTADLVIGLRYGPLAVGGGASLSVGVAGGGTTLHLEQDASGARVDAAADIRLPYRPAPLMGLRLDLGRFAIGATFRGATDVDLALENVSRVELRDNPLNGTITVKVSGASGYDPARIDAGVSVALPWGVAAHGAIEVAVYSASPPPVADVAIDVRLGTIPSQREARFIEPRFRTTVSPRLGLEIRRPAPAGRLRAQPVAGASVAAGGRGTAASVGASAGAGPERAASTGASAGAGPERAASAGASAIPSDSTPDWRWAVRCGYVLAPSPVPRQTGFTSYADATRHGLSLGGGYRLGRVLGVDLSAGLTAELHLLTNRREQKASDALPHASYEVGGHIVYVAASLEGAWR